MRFSTVGRFFSPEKKSFRAAFASKIIRLRLAESHSLCIISKSENLRVAKYGIKNKNRITQGMRKWGKSPKNWARGSQALTNDFLFKKCRKKGRIVVLKNRLALTLPRLIGSLTARIGGSKLRSMGFMMMKTCWFLWVSPVSSRRAALQKYCTHPCLPKKVEGRPKGRPSLKGKLWMPPDKRTGSPPATNRTD